LSIKSLSGAVSVMLDKQVWPRRLKLKKIRVINSHFI
jgi:hypothetical protein